MLNLLLDVGSSSLWVIFPVSTCVNCTYANCINFVLTILVLTVLMLNVLVVTMHNMLVVYEAGFWETRLRGVVESRTCTGLRKHAVANLKKYPEPGNIVAHQEKKS